MIRTTLKALSAAVLTMGLAAVSAAGEPTEANTVIQTGRFASDPDVLTKVVNFADLNLSREAGIETLYQRLNGAAKYVCSPMSGSRDLATQSAWKACRNTALTDAVAHIDHPGLTAYVARLNGKDSTRMAAR